MTLPQTWTGAGSDSDEEGGAGAGAGERKEPDDDENLSVDAAMAVLEERQGGPLGTWACSTSDDDLPDRAVPTPVNFAKLPTILRIFVVIKLYRTRGVTPKLYCYWKGHRYRNSTRMSGTTHDRLRDCFIAALRNIERHQRTMPADAVTPWWELITWDTDRLSALHREEYLRVLLVSGIGNLQVTAELLYTSFL